MPFERVVCTVIKDVKLGTVVLAVISLHDAGGMVDVPGPL